MTEPLHQYDIFIDGQRENIAREKLKIYFDNIVDVLNALDDHDVYIQSVDTIATNLLNIDVDQLNDIIILDHPLIFNFRDLTIELLQKQNYIYINLINLFTKFYSKLNDDILSKLHNLFFHHLLLDALVHYRLNEEFSDIIDQFLIKLVSVHKKRYHSADYFNQKGVYLDEMVTYLCSSAYVDTFNHLFTATLQPDKNELDDVEEFYLVTCPNYVCFSRENGYYMQASLVILEKMFQVYFDILVKFTKIIKKSSRAIIKSVEWLLALLQSITVSHEIRQKFTNISQNLIGVLCTIADELSLQQESHTHNLLVYTIAQIFYATFESELLSQIKQINMVPTLLKLWNSGKNERIQLESCRLLSVIMNADEIENRLTDATRIIKMFFSDLSHSLCNSFFKFRLENSLFCLKNLIKNNQIRMEFIKQKGLSRMITYVTKRNVQFISMTVRQRALEILLDLTVNEKVFTYLKRDHLFLFHVKNLLLSSSEHGLQQAAQAIIEKLDTQQDFIEVTEKQDNIMTTSDDLYIDNNYDILISYSPVDRDMCYQIRNQLVKDNFRVRFDLNSARRSEIRFKTDDNKDSKIVLLCISESYVQSDHCQWKAQFALEHQFCIIPVILQSSNRQIEWLRTIHSDRAYIDFSKFEFEYAYEKLRMQIIQQNNQLQRDLNESTDEAQCQETELIASVDLISMNQELTSTIEICPVSIYEFLSALDEWGLMKSVPVSEETFVLIWFDPNLENVDRALKIFCQKINDFIRYYIDLEQCISVVNSIVTSKIVLVTAAEVAPNLLPHIKPLRCVDSIFIYSTNSEGEHYKPDDHPKVVDVFSDFRRLRCKIQRTVEELDKHLQVRRSFNTCKSKQDVITEFGDFLWLHLFIEAAQILYCGSNENHGNHELMELVDIAQAYYRGDSHILKKIDDFRNTYRPEDAIQLYTASDFPFGLLNKALRTENLELLIPFLFFIVDLKKCLACEHYNLVKEKLTPDLFFTLMLKQCVPRVYHNLAEEKTVILYRGINMPLEELEKFKYMEGELISVNGFLSTSRSRKVANMFADVENNIAGNAAVIFKIECDPTILEDNFIFADISRYSRFPDEEEVLIDISAVFRLTNIKQDLDGMWVINMMASNEVIPIAKKYIEDYKIILLSTEKNRRHFKFHALLSDRSRYEKAQEHLEKLLDKPNGEEIAVIYATMTRASELNQDHEILVRDHYDYTRDRLSKKDFKQSACTLNKIGFFLPRYEQIYNSQEILKILEVNEGSPDKSMAMKSFTSVLPYIGDTYRKPQALWNFTHNHLATLMETNGRLDVALLKLKEQCMEQGLYEEAQVYHELISDVCKDK